MEFTSITFSHDLYDLDDKTGVLSRKPGIPVPPSAEERNVESCSVLEAVTSYIQVLTTHLSVQQFPLKLGKDVVARSRRALDS